MTLETMAIREPIVAMLVGEGPLALGCEASNQARKATIHERAPNNSHVWAEYPKT
jgi:hypothetical protein